MLLALLACAPAPLDSSAPPVCPRLSGFEQAADQAWRVHDGAESATAGSWTRQIERDGPHVRTVRQGTLTSNDAVVVDFVDEREWTCDADGLWWNRRVLELVLSDRTSLEVTDWSVPPLVLPHDAQAGSSWSGTQEYVLTVNGDTDAPLVQDYTVELGPPVLLTVPAGTFQVFEWRLGGQVQLLADGVGVIRDLDGELVSR